MLPKEDFRIEASLQIVPPDTAHVLGDHTANLPDLNVRDELFPTGPLKVCPAPSIVRIVDRVRESPLGGVAFEHSLLIHDGVTVPNLLIVTTETLV